MAKNELQKYLDFLRYINAYRKDKDSQHLNKIIDALKDLEDEAFKVYMTDLTSSLLGTLKLPEWMARISDHPAVQLLALGHLCSSHSKMNLPKTLNTIIDRITKIMEKDVASEEYTEYKERLVKWVNERCTRGSEGSQKPPEW